MAVDWSALDNGADGPTSKVSKIPSNVAGEIQSFKLPTTPNLRQGDAVTKQAEQAVGQECDAKVPQA